MKSTKKEIIERLEDSQKLLDEVKEDVDKIHKYYYLSLATALVAGFCIGKLI